MIIYTNKLHYSFQNTLYHVKTHYHATLPCQKHNKTLSCQKTLYHFKIYYIMSIYTISCKTFVQKNSVKHYHIKIHYIILKIHYIISKYTISFKKYEREVIRGERSYQGERKSERLNVTKTEKL